MGNLIQRTLQKLVQKTPQKILLLGLDNAGKSTLLYQMKFKEALYTTPTIGFNVEKLVYKNLEMVFWDVGGQEKLQALWHHYYEGTSCICFIIDCAEGSERMERARDVLREVISVKGNEGIPLLVFANKQDVYYRNAEDVAKILNLYEIKDREWSVQPCSALKGEGVYEGFDWVSKQLKNKKKK